MRSRVVQLLQLHEILDLLSAPAADDGRGELPCQATHHVSHLRERKHMQVPMMEPCIICWPLHVSVSPMAACTCPVTCSERMASSGLGTMGVSVPEMQLGKYFGKGTKDTVIMDISRTIIVQKYSQSLPSQQ